MRRPPFPAPFLLSALIAALTLLLPMTALPADQTATTPATAAAATADDPYLWLEEVQGERALAWVRERNTAARKVLEAQPRFAEMRDGFRAILDSRDKIPYVSRRGDALYNFWRDAEHPRGLWRRTTLAEYRLPAPAWETVIDLDALAKSEGENWVWAGASCLAPDYRRCLVKLSRGGADAHVVREFDSRSKAFVGGGFSLPEAKSEVVWLSADTVYVGTDFGPGSLTDSGYPRVVKRWQRGQPLSAASTVFEGQAQDVAAGVSVDNTPGFAHVVFSRATDFYNSVQFVLQGDRLQRINIPSDAAISFWRDRALLQLRSDWTTGAGDQARRWPSWPPPTARRCRRCRRCSRPARPARWPGSAPPPARCWSTCSTTWPASSKPGGPRPRLAKPAKPAKANAGSDAPSRPRFPARCMPARCTIPSWPARRPTTRWPKPSR
jgi:prolyl oligopeptidase